MGFSLLGLNPGISHDGNVVAFYGEGPTGSGISGIFVSTKTTGGWQAPQLVASSGDGFSGFIPDSRVSVEIGQCGVQQPVVAFIATSGGGTKGLYTVSLKSSSLDNTYVRDLQTRVCYVGQPVGKLHLAGPQVTQ